MPLLWEKKDIVTENRIGNHFANQWGLLYLKTVSEIAIFDAGFFHEKLTSRNLILIGELKGRGLRAGQYPDIMLSSDKVTRVCQIARDLHKPAIFGIETQRDNPPQYWWTNLLEAEHIKPVWGGRTATPRISTDIEYVIHIPWQQFHRSYELPI